jgi:hypothetical protein
VWNGDSYVVFNLTRMQIDQGAITTGDAENRLILLKARVGTGFDDVTQQFFGVSAYHLNAAAAQTLIADINRDGQPDILIAANNEDGRANDATATNKIAQSQVLLSQPDHTYKSVNIGAPTFGAERSFLLDTSGPEVLIHLAGITPAPTSQNVFDGDIVMVTSPVYKLAPDGNSFSYVRESATFNYGSVLLPAGKVATIANRNGGVMTLAVAESDAQGKWSISSVFDPFPEAGRVATYYSWNTEPFYNSPYRLVDGHKLFDAFYSIFGSISSDPAAPIIFAGLAGAVIDQPAVDGAYYLRGSDVINKYFFLGVENGKLVETDYRIIGASNLGRITFDIMDVNKDGLIDIVQQTVRSQGGYPDVYLNDGHHHFIRADIAVFPNSGAANSYGVFVPHGDRFDIIFTGTGVNTQFHVEPIVEYALQPFPFGRFGVTALDVSTDLEVFRTLQTEGKLQSIALIDTTPGTIALTSAQLAQSAAVLDKITSAFDLSISVNNATQTISGYKDHAWTAVLSGKLSDYTFDAVNSLGAVVAHNGAATMTLNGASSIVFSDATITAASWANAQNTLSNILRTPATSSVSGTTALQLAAGPGTAQYAQAIAQVVSAADTTTSVATLAYQFFTGKIPTSGGYDYLVSPTGPNPNNLNAAYYQSFNLENRYINFAVNLGKLGEGKDAFAASYGSMSLFDATKAAYTRIFGGAPTDAKVHALLDPTFNFNGQTITRADYFGFYGLDGPNGIGTKAAMVGWLLAEAEKADIGMYARANAAFLTDLADGATFNIDLIGVYGRPEYLFGA